MAMYLNPKEFRAGILPIWPVWKPSEPGYSKKPFADFVFF